MTKQEIIGIINEAVPKIKTDIFKEEGDKKNIGCNQFRELANICRHSDCYEEIEMLIRYSEAKVKATNISWAAAMKDNKSSFAEIIINCMKEIRGKSPDEKDCMKDLSLFFGYFYWNARIWAAENKAAESNFSDNRGGNSSYNNNFRNNGNNKNGNAVWQV